MLTDRYGLALSTKSPAASDAYLEGYDLLLTLYPGPLPPLTVPSRPMLASQPHTSARRGHSSSAATCHRRVQHWPQRRGCPR